jgi:hypothetical protein
MRANRSLAPTVPPRHSAALSDRDADRAPQSGQAELGAPKIRERLVRLYPDIHTPAISTIHAVLDRHGLVKRRRTRRNRATGTELSRPGQPNELPARGAVLDRFKAIDRYTAENTQLICDLCDKVIEERGYR